MGLQSLPTFSSLPSNLPLDWVVIGALVIIIAFDAFRSGAGRACILSLALPAAMLLDGLVSHTAYITTFVASLSTPIMQAALFLGLSAFMVLILVRMGLAGGAEAGAPVQAAFAGVATVAILVSVWLQVPVLDSIWHFGPQVQAIFAQQYRLWWIAGSYLALAIARS